LENRPCLVIGAGSIALGKIEELLLAGAVVTVIAPEAVAEVAKLPVTLLEREFQAGDTAGFAIVISATGIREVDAHVFHDGSSSGALVNAVDNPDSCNFFLPALLRRGELSVAISTGGASPAIASWVRERLGEALDERFGEIVDFVGVTRDAIRARGLSTEGLPWSELIDQMVAAVESGSGAAHCRALCDLWLEGVPSSPAAGEQGVDE
jgi:siroheme synthase-like protein